MLRAAPYRADAVTPADADGLLLRRFRCRLSLIRCRDIAAALRAIFRHAAAMLISISPPIAACLSPLIIFFLHAAFRLLR